MKVKKIISFALAAAFASSLFSMTAFAAETSGDGEEAACYVLTQETPEEILEYAKNEFQGYLSVHLASNGIDASRSQYELGYPINLEETGSTNRIYDFPIMQDGEIFAILTIYDDNGEYYIQIEQNLMSETLNELKAESSQSNPIAIVSIDEGLYAVVNDNVEPLTPDSGVNDLNTSSLTSSSVAEPDVASNYTVMNLSESLAVADGNDVEPLDTSENPSPLGVVSVPQTDDGTFSGTQKEWCGAAVTAAIINYKKGTSLTAKSVTKEALGSAKNQGLTNAQVVSVGNNHGISPKAGNPLSYSSVKTEINGYRPVYMQMRRSTDDGYAYHALALIGYSSTKYTVINPWYSSSLTLTKKTSGSDVTYVTGTRTYKWYKSVYNWK